MGLAISWLSHLQGKAREDFKKTVLNSTLVLGRLRDILTQQLESLTLSELDPDQFEEASWSYHAAYRFGQRAAYKEMIRLLEFTDDGK